jgi:ATP-dependent exoDNAse (exonuclease V) alpha subunit
MDQQQDNLAEAWEALHGNENIFLTGPAGSGKSTLIRKYIAANDGNVIVLAPTGIAAINVGGVTVHNFFHFPARPVSYNAIKWLDPRKDEDEAKRKLILSAKAFIIDEVSMLRADLMDQIAWFFKKNFPDLPPFAGKKIIMVGDLDQLPPVVKDDSAEKQMISTRYTSPFFFAAACWDPARYSSFITFKLTKVWRQSDPAFVNLLNDIKNARLAPFEIDRLNNQCLRQGDLFPEDGIVLCAKNSTADEINSFMLHNLEGENIRLVGRITGNFNKKDCICEEIINLKIGCRVMTLRNSNDPINDYRNGSLGTLVAYNENTNLLEVLLDNKETVFVSRFEFESTEYEYNKKEDRISHKITGRFVQFPIKVAYAITIHKAQGQTFDKIIIDTGERGAFAHGQVYVALSRCTSLQGIILRRPLKYSELIYDKNILEFNKTKLNV